MPRSRFGRTNGGRDRGERVGAEGFGRRSETIAAWYLRLKGYRILARRVRTPVGEIDLVARRGAVTVFVEVKARRGSTPLAVALEQVNTDRLARAAALYVARHPGLAGSELRFDVILLAPFSWPRHVKNVFQS